MGQGFTFQNPGFTGLLSSSAVPPPLPTVYRFNGGGQLLVADTYTDSQGNEWNNRGATGEGFSYGANGFPSPDPDRPLYENVWIYDTPIHFDVADGTYQVTGIWRELYTPLFYPGGRLVGLRVAGGASLLNAVDGYRADRAPVVRTSPTLVTAAGGAGITLQLMFEVESPVMAAVIFTRQ
jgi:hypothetical protein